MDETNVATKKYEVGVSGGGGACGVTRPNTP